MEVSWTSGFFNRSLWSLSNLRLLKQGARRPVLFLQSGDAVEYGLNRCFLTDRRVDHEMKALPVGPFDAKILLDESCPVAVHGFGQVYGFALAFSARLQPPDFRVKRSVNKYVKGIATALQIIGGSTAHNHALATFGRIFHNPLRHFADAFGIRHLQPGSIQTAFKTAAHEGLEETVQQGISLFLVFLHHSIVAIHLPGNFVGQQLIPKLPAEPAGDSLRNVGATASVFALDRNHPNHEYILVQNKTPATRCIFLQGK